MTVFQAVVLGLVQGLAEFLPISSSAHLVLTPWVFGWSDPGLAFDVALHVGTLVAVLWYFRAEWVSLTRSAFAVLRHRRADTEDARRFLYLVGATIPAAIAGFLLEDIAATTFRSPRLLAVMLMVMGVLLWAADRFAPRDRPLGTMGWRDALLIGLAQVAALVPGVSRSGSTMTAGRALRFDRQSAAVFSFLMSMPVTAAAAILKVPELVRAEGITAPLVAGIVSAGISSWLAIAVLLRYVARHSFGVFALYRLALGTVILVLLASRG
ncbi:MAG TPA: undecaprenyl-diphosphate phosphatase [Gemmatimonadaceae bacterium]|jgi:undecaprenyl-diphosphatase|nr:undecaprenyl-diphosphate phosphatase [Gemmatimonadaceae bacterium]